MTSVTTGHLAAAPPSHYTVDLESVNLETHE
jgi:hypothetical protein